MIVLFICITTVTLLCPPQYVTVSLLVTTKAILRPQLFVPSYRSRITHWEWCWKGQTSKPSLLVTHMAWLLPEAQDSQGALAGWLSWLEHRPIHQNVAGSICGQGTYPGCGFDPQSGHIREATNRCFSLTSMFLSLPPFLSLQSQEKKRKQWKAINMSLGED